MKEQEEREKEKFLRRAEKMMGVTLLGMGVTITGISAIASNPTSFGKALLAGGIILTIAPIICIQIG